MKRNYVTTFVTSGLAIASYLLVFRLVAARLGPHGFGEYALSRRALSLLAPLCLLGADLAVARYVAFADRQQGSTLRSYPSAALAIAVPQVLLISAVLLVFSTSFAQLFFGSANFQPLIWSMPLLLAGTALYAVAYGYLRGRLKVLQANLLLGLNQGIVPVAVIFVAPPSVSWMLTLMGLAWIAISVSFLALIPLSPDGLRRRVPELARYGFPRMPSDFLQLALFSLPGILLAHISDIRVAGVVAFGVAGLGMVGSALSPVNFLLLPVAARLVANRSVAKLRKHVIDTHRLTLAGLIIGTILLEIFAQPIVMSYLGPQFVDDVNVLRVVGLAVLPWGLFVTLRSVIDAHHFRAINTRNMFISFLCFSVGAVALGLVGRSPIAVVSVFVFSLFVLSGLTLVEVYRITRHDEETGGPWKTAAELTSVS